MSFIMRNDSFRCIHCQKEVSPLSNGSARNHCPFCLFSLHLDAEFPWDRASDCKAPMHPVDLDVRKKNGVVLVHECGKCGKRIVNKTAPDDDLLWFSKIRAKELQMDL